MLDTKDAATNSEIREVVQDVLVEVIESFSKNAEELVKDDKDNTVEAPTEDKNEDEKKKDEKKDESGVEANAVVSTDLDTTSSDVPAASPVASAPVSAVPKVEVLNPSSIGQAGAVPPVNEVPPTTDVNQTMGSQDAVPNTQITETRATSVDPAEMPPVADPTLAPETVATDVVVESNTGEINTFGTSIVYSQNEDGTFNVTFDKNGVTRVSTLPSLMTTDLLPELEDFLVEAMGGCDPAVPVDTISVTDPVVDTPVDAPADAAPDATTPADVPSVAEEVPPVDSSVTDPLPTDVPDPEATEDIPPVEPVDPAATPEEVVEEEEKKDDGILSHATMASLRKEYANEVMKIFELGLMTKNAIVSESKDKFFAKDKAEYDKKGAILASELKAKKKSLNELTKEYLDVRKERDQIKTVVGLLSSSIQKSQKGLADGYLTDANSEKIIKTVSSIVAKLIKNYGKPEFGAILASTAEHSRKVKFLISSEIAKNKRALVASQSNGSKGKSGILASGMKKEKTQELNTKEKMSAKDKMRAKGIVHRNPELRSNGVIVEGNYVGGRARGTISNMTRHDGMDEMIGEITSLLA